MQIFKKCVYFLPKKREEGNRKFPQVDYYFFEAMQELRMGAGNCLQRSPVGRIYFFSFLAYYVCSTRGLCETGVSGNLASSPGISI